LLRYENYSPFPDISGASNALLFIIETDFLAITVTRAKATPQNRVNLFAKKAACGNAVTNIARYWTKMHFLFENGLGLSIAIE
jgi:hypothetical protein